MQLPVPVAARPKAWVCGREPPEIVGSNSTGDTDVYREFCVCCQVEVSARGLSLFQSSPTDCGASVRVIYKPSERKGPGPLGAVTPK